MTDGRTDRHCTTAQAALIHSIAWQTTQLEEAKDYLAGYNA